MRPLRAVRKMIKRGVGYEILTDTPRKAYYDYETYHEKEDDAARDAELKQAYDHVRKLVGKIKIYSFCASGWKRSHKSYVHSFHFIASKAYEDPQDIPRATMPGFDQGVYGKNCLFRLPFASKEGEDRPLIRVSRGGKRFTLKEIEERGESLKDWSIMNHEGIEVVPRSIRLVMEKKRVERIKKESSRNVTKMNDEDLDELIEKIEDSGVIADMEWEEWIILIWSLKSLGADLNTVLAVSEQSVKYDEAYTTKKYNEGSGHMSPGALVKLLKNHGVSVGYIEQHDAKRYIEENSDTDEEEAIEGEKKTRPVAVLPPAYIDSDPDTSDDEEEKEQEEVIVDLDALEEEEKKKTPPPPTLAEKMQERLKGELAPEIKIKHEDVITEEYEEKYMKEYPEAKTLFVKAPMGCGKTVALMEYIKKIFKEKPSARVLVLSFRCSFGRELNRKLSDAGLSFELYSDIKEHITDENSRVVIQVESLHRLRWTSPPDLLIMDEIESIQHQFISTTQRKLSDCWSVYQWTMNRCEKFICMDADLTQETVDYVMKTRFEKDGAIMVNNTYKPSNKNVVFTARESDLMAKMHELLREGKKIFIANTRAVEWNKALKQAIKKQHPELKIRCYNSSNSSRKQIKEELENPDEAWVKYDVVICTPTIQAGLSFDKQHFDIAFGFFCNIGPIQAKIQMMGRVRNFKDNTFYYSLMQINTNINKVERPARYIAYMESRRAYLDPRINIPDILPSQLNPETQRRYFLCKDLPYFNFYVNKQCELNRENNNFGLNFIDAILRTGCKKWEYLQVGKKEAATARADMKEAKTDVIQKEAELISSSLMLPPYRVTELETMIQANISLSTEEIASLKKYKTLKAYGLNQDDIKDPVEFYKKYVGRGVKTAFSILSRMEDPEASRRAQRGRNQENEEEGKGIEDICSKYDYTDIFWCREIIDIVKFGEVDSTRLLRRYRHAESMIKRNIIPISSVANRKTVPKIRFWPEESYLSNMNRLLNQVLSKIGFQIKLDKNTGMYNLESNSLFCYGNEESFGRPRVWQGVKIGGINHKKMSQKKTKLEEEEIKEYREENKIPNVEHYTQPPKPKTTTKTKMGPKKKIYRTITKITKEDIAAAEDIESDED